MVAECGFVCLVQVLTREKAWPCMVTQQQSRLPREVVYESGKYGAAIIAVPSFAIILCSQVALEVCLGRWGSPEACNAMDKQCLASQLGPRPTWHAAFFDGLWCVGLNLIVPVVP